MKSIINLLLGGLLLFFLVACQLLEKNESANTVTLTDSDVCVNGKPIQILSGEIHYFRVMPECWRDRLLKLRACGLNTVSIYVPWNLHEPQRGEFNFSGRANVVEFLKLCKELNLYVMFRPTPYICSEWEFGGLPAWLIADKNVTVRCADTEYLKAIKSYYDKLLPMISPFYCNNGGPIIAMQLENEYFHYGNDLNYIKFLRDEILESGFKGVLYMADNPPVKGNVILPLKVERVWQTATTGKDFKKAFDAMKKIQPDYPVMISELWVGQGMKLGIPLRVRDVPKMTKELDEYLAKGGHVNLYMFHGGKSFGLMNGALRRTPATLPFTPFISSYDVDALLNEAGDPTEKYFAYREVFLKYNPDAKKYPVPPASEKTTYEKINFTSYSPLYENIDTLKTKTVSSAVPPSMEDMGEYYGMINYKTKIPQQLLTREGVIKGVADRAWVKFNGKMIGSFSQKDEKEPSFEIPTSGGDLEVLVENSARVSYGYTMDDNRKGIKGLLISNRHHFTWEASSLPLTSTDKVTWKKIGESANKTYPAFFKGAFDIPTPKDTYLVLDNFKRGYIYINGKLLGRYDADSPLRTTYIPSGILKKGANTIELLEFDGAENFEATFTNSPIGNVKGENKILK